MQVQWPEKWKANIQEEVNITYVWTTSRDGIEGKVGDKYSRRGKHYICGMNTKCDYG